MLYRHLIFLFFPVIVLFSGCSEEKAEPGTIAEGSGTIQIEGLPTAHFNGAFYSEPSSNTFKVVFSSLSEYGEYPESGDIRPVYPNAPEESPLHEFILGIQLGDSIADYLTLDINEQDSSKIAYGSLTYDYTKDISENKRTERYRTTLFLQPNREQPFEIEIREEEEWIYVSVDCQLIREPTFNEFHKCTFTYEGKLLRP